MLTVSLLVTVALQISAQGKSWVYFTLKASNISNLHPISIVETAFNFM